MAAAVFDTDIRAAFVGGFLDFETHITLCRVEDKVRAYRGRGLQAQRKRVDGNNRIGSGKFGKLDCHQSNRAHPEDGDSIADANVSIAYSAQGKIRRVKTSGSLPGHTF